MKEIINKYTIITFIISGLIFGSIGVGASYLYSSNQLAYTPNDNNWIVDNVKDALNQLYSLSGKIEIIDLGQYSSSCTVDVSNYEGYEKFTKDNFLLTLFRIV